MKNLQQKHKEWCDKNFGNRTPMAGYRDLDRIISVAGFAGKMAHHTLKAFQGIRGGKAAQEDGLIGTAHALLQFMEEWPSRVCDTYAASPLRDLQAMVGVIEEVGELAKAQNHEERVDAVGDIVLYLMDYCNKVGIDFEDAVRVTAEKVHKRDWVKNPENGEVE